MSALTIRLRAAASFRLGETVEGQDWGSHRLFPSQVIIDSRQGAHQTAGSWTREDAIWADGSWLGNERVGAACAWRAPSGWTERRFHLGSNKEVFDAEVYAIYQALSTMGQRQESGRRYTLFVDSTLAIARIRSDDTGPGQ